MISAPALYPALTALFVALSFGSIIRLIALRNAEEKKRQSRLASLRTWWMLAAALSISLLAGRTGICILLCTASCIAWYEITRMMIPREKDNMVIRAGFVLIISNYLLVLFAMDSIFVIFLPIAAAMTIAVLLLMGDDPNGYIRAAGGYFWGIFFLGYGVSHAAFLLSLPNVNSGLLGPAGWFLFLVILTECNDIFQAIVGRAFGKHKRHRISPQISPNKTWEGFIGGMLVTITLALVIAPWLTTLTVNPGRITLSNPLHALIVPTVIAILISVAGFFGDINMSAIKRDCETKDSSNLLPGMGGVVDRIDSLTMTAPVFLYFLQWWMV